MKKLLLALVMLCLVVAVSGCGGGGSSPPPLLSKQILSDETVDADIALAPDGTLTLTQVSRDDVPSVFAGVDPATGDEYRAFLDFPLIIPPSAVVQSATLDIVVDSIQPVNGSVPIRLELVSFPPPVIETDFFEDSLPPLAAKIIDPPIGAADVGHHVMVDVSSLVALAQFRRQQNPLLQNFQLRIMADPAAPSPGIMEIADSSDVSTAPLLNVFYFVQ